MIPRVSRPPLRSADRASGRTRGRRRTAGGRAGQRASRQKQVHKDSYVGLAVNSSSRSLRFIPEADEGAAAVAAAVARWIAASRQSVAGVDAQHCPGQAAQAAQLQVVVAMTRGDQPTAVAVTTCSYSKETAESSSRPSASASASVSVSVSVRLYPVNSIEPGAVLDCTGCGDSFAAGWIAGVLSELHESAKVRWDPDWALVERCVDSAHYAAWLQVHIS